jgi:hypothetical protein
MHNRTAAEIVNDVIMLGLARPQDAFLIVEGVDDFRFWRSRVGVRCSVVDATGKPSGTAATRTLNALNSGRHLGLFDRDYDDIFAHSDVRANIIFWDAHSLETVLFRSPAGDKLIAEKLPAEAVAKFEKTSGKTLRELVNETCFEFGRIRYLHHLRSGKVDVEALSLFRVFEKGAGILMSTDKLHEEAARAGAVPSVVQARNHIENVHGIDDHLMVRGHDISAFVSIVARELGGSCGIDAAEEALRLGFENVHLQDTTVFAEIRAWQDIRVPYEILKS